MILLLLELHPVCGVVFRLQVRCHLGVRCVTRMIHGPCWTVSRAELAIPFWSPKGGGNPPTLHAKESLDQCLTLNRGQAPSGRLIQQIGQTFSSSAKFIISPNTSPTYLFFVAMGSDGSSSPCGSNSTSFASSAFMSSSAWGSRVPEVAGPVGGASVSSSSADCKGGELKILNCDDEG